MAEIQTNCQPMLAPDIYIFLFKIDKLNRNGWDVRFVAHLARFPVNLEVSGCFLLDQTKGWDFAQSVRSQVSEHVWESQTCAALFETPFASRRRRRRICSVASDRFPGAGKKGAQLWLEDSWKCPAIRDQRN